MKISRSNYMSNPDTPPRKPVLSDFFDDDLKMRLELETGEGSALPNIAYTSREFHDFEQTSLFRRTWVFAAASHQLKNPGTT